MNPISSLFFIQYEVRPAPHSEAFATVGGAFANCFVTATDNDDALDTAQRHLRDNDWEVLSIEEGPFRALREYYEEDADWLGYFELALSEGECFVFHQWPPEPQQDDVLH